MAEMLPRPRTPFFGRELSLARIRRLLTGHRLVTLTGVGGSGKTRLALRVAELAKPELADEVGWVALASLRDPRLLAPTVCSSLDIPLAAGISPSDALINRLQSPRWLLVLDNCEQILSDCAELVDTILERCPDLSVLATSREALGLPGEISLPLPPLSLPEEGAPDQQVDKAMDAASIRLFVDRARAVRPDFELTPANVGIVARLCSQLEGIPLALELAAARVRALTVEQIAERLNEGLDLLGGPGRQVAPRHRTMRAALAWSHDLLSQRERILFRRLGVFGRDADLEGCEAVCADEALAQSAILDLLTRLIDKSLVAVDDRGSIARFRLLEPVRHFARERLEASGELEPVGRRHAEHYLEVAQCAAHDLRGRDRAAALGRLTSDHDNLRGAWEYAVDAGDDRIAAALARALFWFWNFGGHFSEGRMRTEDALERLAPEGPARLDLLYVAGTLAWMQGDYELARERLETCASDCRQAGNAELFPLVLRELAGVRMMLGDPAVAAQLYKESIARLRESKAAWDLGLALVVSSEIRDGLGDAAGAREQREEARMLFGKVGDSWGLSLTHFTLGQGAARAGDLPGARVYAREALALQRAAGDKWNMGQILALLGEIEARAGHAEQAAELLLESIEAFREVGDRTALVYAIARLAEVERQRGRTLRAVRLVGTADAHAETLEGAYPYALAGDDERAETVKALRRMVGEQAFAEEWAQGRVLGLEDAVSFALDADGALRPGASGVQEAGDSAALRIFALGAPQVYLRHRRLVAADWTYALPKALFFYLLVQGPRTKEQIGLEFWPEASPEQLRGRFRTAVYELRRALGGTEWVRYANGRYDLNRDQDYWFDAQALESGIDRAMVLLETDPTAAATHLQGAIGLYRGDFLEGEDSPPWVSDHRDRLRRRYLDALLTLGDLRTSEGAHAESAELYRRAVACEDLNERAHRGLARSLAHGGNRAGALRQLDELAELLRRELDAEPSAETAELRTRLEQS